MSDEREPQTIKVHTVDDFAEALKRAEKGDTMIYYTGNHVGGDICRFASRMADQGYVALVQRRLARTGVGKFQYEAQKTKKRFK